MNPINQLFTSIANLYRTRKKTFIISCLFGVVALVGLFIAFLQPSTLGETKSLEEKELSAEQISPPAIAVNETTNEEENHNTEEPGETTPGIKSTTVITKYPDPTDVPLIDDKIVEHFLKEYEGTPTPTPLPGTFYIANGQQNDLKLWHYMDNDDDVFYEAQLINTKTTETRIMGYSFAYSPGDSRFFTRDFSQVVFIGGSKKDYNQISFYSIPQNRIVKAITVDQIKKAIPNLKINDSSILSSMVPSPDLTRIAVSYGNTFSYDRIVPDTAIIVINLQTNQMKLLPTKGLVKGWKDTTTLEYEVNTTDKTKNNTLEVKVTGI